MKTIRPTLAGDPLIEGPEPNTHMLLTCGIEVTVEQHLELLESPKKCDLLGLDNTYERLVYGQRHEWFGWPEMPEIDPNEEIDS